MAELISHIYQANVEHWIIQSNEEHSVGVTRLASRFASIQNGTPSLPKFDNQHLLKAKYFSADDLQVYYLCQLHQYKLL